MRLVQVIPPHLLLLDIIISFLMKLSRATSKVAVAIFETTILRLTGSVNVDLITRNHGSSTVELSCELYLLLKPCQRLIVSHYGPQNFLWATVANNG